MQANRKAPLKLSILHSISLLLILAPNTEGKIPKNYKGKPFRDAMHTTGPQVIPGRLEAALYDLGGEGIAYHDTDKINHGSGELNYTKGHCEEGVPVTICHFREDEGVDISYVKKLADLNHPSPVMPDWQQLYLGWRIALDSVGISPFRVRGEAACTPLLSE